MVGLARCLGSLTVAAFSTSVLPAQCALRDLVVANVAGATLDWTVERATSSGGLNAFTATRWPLCTGPGTVLAIEPGESFGRGLTRLLVSEPIASPPFVQSVLYSFFSPFLRSGSFQNCPPVPFFFPLGHVVTDIKADHVFTANEAFWFVYLDTTTTPAQLTLKRGTSLSPGGSVVLSTSARSGFVSVDGSTGIVYVLDDGASLHRVDPITFQVGSLALARTIPIEPTDMVYDPVPSQSPGRIIVVGRDPTNPGVGLLQRYTLAGALAYHYSVSGLVPGSLSVDETGDYYFLHDAPGGSAVLHADNATNTLTPVLVRTARMSAVSWIGRAAWDVFRTSPGTRLMGAGLARPPFVGSTSLDYTVAPAMPLVALVFAISDRFNPSGPFLAPEAQVLVDLASPLSAIVPIAVTTPDIRIPIPVVCAMNGRVWHTQFFGLDAAATWIASGVVSLTVGHRPRE